MSAAVLGGPIRGPTIDPFGTAKPTNDFQLSLPDASEASGDRPPSPSLDGETRVPRTTLKVGNGSTVTVQDRAGASFASTRHPLVSGENGSVEALGGLRQDGRQPYLDAGIGMSGRATSGSLVAAGGVDLVGSVPLRGASGDPGAAYATLEADARLTIGDAFVGGSANASTVPGAPVELDASAGVRTPIGTLSVHRIWDAGDPRAETFARLTTDGGLSVQAGPDKVQVNFRARF